MVLTCSWMNSNKPHSGFRFIIYICISIRWRLMPLPQLLPIRAAEIVAQAEYDRFQTRQLEQFSHSHDTGAIKDQPTKGRQK